MGRLRIISRRDKVRNEKNQEKSWGTRNGGRKDKEKKTYMVWTCGADGWVKTANRSFTRPCGRKEKQEAEEDLDGQCQGRPEGETYRLDQNW